MRVRPTVRVLLLDREDRLLLIKYRNMDQADAPPQFWATVGGGMEPGETIQAAAVRETLEETGIADVELGPIVAYGEWILRPPKSEPRLFQEHYIVVRCTTGALDDAGWTQLERDTILEMRWWTLAEIAAADERIYPPGLVGLLARILAKDYPAEPIIVESM